MTPTAGIPVSWIADVLNALAANGLPMSGAPSQLTDTVCAPTTIHAHATTTYVKPSRVGARAVCTGARTHYP